MTAHGRAGGGLGCRVPVGADAPDAVLAISDAGRAALAVNAHPDDADQDCMVFIWSGTWAASMGPPNDEARSGHRLYQRGLSGLRRAGQVEQSEWITTLELQNHGHPHHDASHFAKLSHVDTEVRGVLLDVRDRPSSGRTAEWRALDMRMTIRRSLLECTERRRRTTSPRCQQDLRPLADIQFVLLGASLKADDTRLRYLRLRNALSVPLLRRCPARAFPYISSS